MDNPQPTSNPTLTSRSMHGKVWTFLALLVLLIALGIGSYLLYSHYKKPAPAISIYQSYKNYSVQSTASSASIDFIAPSSLKQIVNAKGLVTLYQQWTSGGAQGLTYLAAKAQANSPSLDSAALNAIDNNFNSYKNSVNPVTNFVQTNMVDGWQTQITSASKFTNSTISAHALELDFTAVQGSGKLQGKVVYASTASTNYYFIVYSNAHNWQANAGAWQKILNSLKTNS